jgi:cyclic-di-GMP-binding protein
MAQEYSFDVVSQFDAQELRNAIDQTKREIQNRYDFKGTNTEIVLADDDITITAADTMKLKAVLDIITQKMVNRGLSPKLLDIQDHQPAAQAMLRQVLKLKKTLNQEQCKSITKLIKEKFNKAKTSIQGDTVRVSSKDKDELQAVMAALKGSQLDAPLQFTNYR